jgi:4-hydroxybenzoate polyprenyltransferase
MHGALPLVPSLPRRLWQYQLERFPLARHGPLILVFAGGAVGYGATLSRTAPRPALAGLAVVVVLLQFLLMRLADEFKDQDDDRRWRPERPVPRGLVRLRELAGLGLACTALQWGLVAMVAPVALPWLAVVWGWFALNGAEFFCRRWLRARPGLYALSHLPIVPLLALVALRPQIPGPLPLPSLLPFLGCVYVGGLLIELARKIHAPQQERPGVESYSALWGFRPALALWVAVLLLSAALALAAAARLGAQALLLPLLAPLLALAAVRAGPWLAGRRRPDAVGDDEPLAALTALWILATYAGLGGGSWAAWLVGGWR